MTEFIRTKQFNRLYVRVPLIIIGMLLLAATAITIRGQALKKDVDKLVNEYRLEKASSFESTIDTGFELELTLARDYSIWDELIEAMNKNDKAWLSANIEPALQTYHSAAAWVVDSKYNTKYYAVDSEQLKDNSIPIDLKKDHQQIFKDGYFVDYFTIKDGDIYRIAIAPIQPTSDTERQTPPQGYFVVAKKLNADFVAKAEKSNGVSLRLHQGTTDQQSDEIDQGIIRFTQPMYDWRGDQVAYYAVAVKSTFLRSQLQNLSSQYQVFSISIALVFIGIALVAYFVVSAPLKDISEAIQRGDGRQLHKMLKRKDELGDIARLVQKNIDQTNELKISYQQKEQAEQTATAQAAQFERANKLMVGRELRMIELKRQNEQLKKRLEQSESNDDK